MLMLCPYAAQCFLGNAEVRCYVAQWRALHQYRVGSQQQVIALLCGLKLYAQQAAIQLYVVALCKQTAYAFRLREVGVQPLQCIMA